MSRPYLPPSRREDSIRIFSGRCRDQGFTAIDLQNDTPHLLAAKGEVTKTLASQQIDVLLCHGYKAGMVGWFAARSAGKPVVAVSRGWTGENFKVRMYERLDRLMLRRMDKVICVSHAQAEKVRAAGVREDRIEVIHNAIDVTRFENPDPSYRQKLLEFFPEKTRSEVEFVIGSAGRLSPEKGFDVLIDAAALVVKRCNHIGFVLFGDGEMADELKQQLKELGLNSRFILAGFTGDLDLYMPHFHLFVQSSHTEGLPNVLMESLAAGVPVIATNVGGTAEVLEQGRFGQLIPPANASILAKHICQTMRTPNLSAGSHNECQTWDSNTFNFGNQAHNYHELFDNLIELETTCPA